MTWLIWRQHRGEALGAGLVLAALGILLLLHGLPMHEAYERGGVEAWEDLPQQVAVWLPFLPMLAGMLIGSPLLAREFEQGTWQLAWTQGVTRRRWLATKLALVLGGVATLSVVFAAGVSWWFGPLTPQSFTPEKFNHAVLVFPAYVVVAVAIGILAGVVVRRTLVAAAITIGGYLAVRLPIEFYLRPRYREPLTTQDPSVAQGWVIHDSGGGPAPGSAPTGQPISYHPDDRFWEFQLIETAILMGITTVLLAIAWRLVLGKKTPPDPRESRRTAPLASAT